MSINRFFSHLSLKLSLGLCIAVPTVHHGGVSGLPGIQEQLDHFQYLKIKSVWISPFYRSPMKDFGYDVEDFRAIDPLFGTMQDFEELLAEMHNKGVFFQYPCVYKRLEVVGGRGEGGPLCVFLGEGNRVGLMAEGKSFHS